MERQRCIRKGEYTPIANLREIVILNIFETLSSCFQVSGDVEDLK